MDREDDDLSAFEAGRPAPLSLAGERICVEHDGARLWCAVYGAGSPVILLHGGLGHSGNWDHQVPALVEAGYRVIAMDSRGHGRSTRDARPYSYALMASDVIAVMDALGLERAALVGWSDGACVALVLAMTAPTRVAGVFFFACNMNPEGARPFEPSPIIARCFRRHAQDYAALSETPANFKGFVEAVSLMQRTQPDSSAEELASVTAPVAIVQGEQEEFIKREHAEYLARSIPGAELIILPGVSHFAPLQRPKLFNRAVMDFLARLAI